MKNSERVEKLMAQRDKYQIQANKAMERGDYNEAAKFLKLVDLYNHKIGKQQFKEWMNK